MKDIHFGRAVVPWAAAKGDLPAGWVLPGGARTSEELVASVAAALINDAIREASRETR